MSTASAAEVVVKNTRQQRGFSHPLTETGQQFIDFCRASTTPVLDVGAGNGVATLPALAQGSRVIAMDIEPTYLAQLEKCLPPEHKARLRTIVGAFPAALSQVDEPIGAALLSFVLGFLSGREITEGLSRLFTRMARGGRIFIVDYTPYTAATQKYLRTYNDKVEADHPWPGYCKNIAQQCNNPNLLQHFPSDYHFLDCEVLMRELRRAKFCVTGARYYGGDAVTEPYRMHGREWVEVIAEKL